LLVYNDTEVTVALWESGLELDLEKTWRLVRAAAGTENQEFLEKYWIDRKTRKMNRRKQGYSANSNEKR